MSSDVVIAVALGGCMLSSIVSTGVMLYYSRCSVVDNEEDCNDSDNCHWDTYGSPAKCISIDDATTPGPLGPGPLGPGPLGPGPLGPASPTAPPPCSTYGSWSECEPHFARCQYDWHAPTGQPKCIPTGQALTPAPACSTYTSSFICEQNDDRCHWDTYNIAGATCVPLSTPLTSAPPTGVCRVRTATENDYFIQNMTAWAGDGMLTIATTKCNARTTEPACTSTSDNVFGDNDGITWNLYTEGYRDTKYNDVCKWAVGG